MSREHNVSGSNAPDPKGASFDLRTRMLVYFGLLFALTIVLLRWVEFYGIPFTSFHGGYMVWKSEEFSQLGLVADLKKERLTRWLKERRDDTRMVSENRILSIYVTQLQNAIREKMERGLDNAELWTAVQNDRAYQVVIELLELVITAYYGVYEDIQIADAETGTIMVATRDTDLGMSVSTEDYFTKALGLGENYINIKECPQTRKIELFVSHVIKAVGIISGDKEKPQAVIVMHINPNDFITSMLQTGEGLGKTGEALLVDRNVKILAKLKYPLTDGTQAQPLEYEIQAKPARFAASGREGIIMTQDYRDVPVLAAYRHIRISPELVWGMVVKQDRAEVFRHLRQSIFYSILIGSISILCIISVTYAIATRLSRPIRLLSQTAQKVEFGDFDALAQVTKGAPREISALTGTFNSMVERIQNWYDELDEQVQLRTNELNETLVEKETLIKEIHHRVKNNLQSLIYLIDMQAERIEDTEALSMVRDLQGRFEAMAIVNEKLYQSEDLAQVDFEDYLEDLAPHLLNALGNNRDISLCVDAADLIISMDIAIPCGLIINELVTNALKYAFPDPDVSDGEIDVALKSQDGEYVLTVSDNGVGLPSEMDWRTTESLGLRLVNIWATYQLGGSIEVDTQQGTTFIIRFTGRESGGTLNG